jgi:hypothetical protein
MGVQFRAAPSLPGADSLAQADRQLREVVGRRARTLPDIDAFCRNLRCAVASARREAGGGGTGEAAANGQGVA